MKIAAVFSSQLLLRSQKKNSRLGNFISQFSPLFSFFLPLFPVAPNLASAPRRRRRRRRHFEPTAPGGLRLRLRRRRHVFSAAPNFEGSEGEEELLPDMTIKLFSPPSFHTAPSRKRGGRRAISRSHVPRSKERKGGKRERVRRRRRRRLRPFLLPFSLSLSLRRPTP